MLSGSAQCSGLLAVQSKGEGGLLSGPSWGLRGGRGGVEQNLRQIQSGFEFNGTGSSALLFIFFLLYSSRFFKGGNLEPDVPVSLLPVLCVTDLLVCKLGTVFHLVLLLLLLCVFPSSRKTLLPMAKHLPICTDRMHPGHLSLSPKNLQDLEFLAAFPHIFSLKRKEPS